MGQNSQRRHISRRLQPGDAAPRFQSSDVFGNKISLKDYHDSFVLLAFLRYSGCPWCNLTIHRLTLEYPMLSKNGCRVVAFMQSTPESVHKNIYGRHKERPPFPIISDKQRDVYNAYGVRTSIRAVANSITDVPYWLKAVIGSGFGQTELSGNMFLVPAMFLVSPGDQTIVKTEYSASFYEHQTFTGVYESLIFER